MDDLKSYAEHRQSQTVDMKDVLLYLQRINFAGKGSSTNETEIDRILNWLKIFASRKLNCIG